MLWSPKNSLIAPSNVHESQQVKGNKSKNNLHHVYKSYEYYASNKNGKLHFHFSKQHFTYVLLKTCTTTSTFKHFSESPFWLLFNIKILTDFSVQHYSHVALSFKFFNKMVSKKRPVWKWITCKGKYLNRKTTYTMFTHSVISTFVLSSCAVVQLVLTTFLF